MTHRAESILAAVTTQVTGLATTGSNVVRGRVYPTGAAAALSVDMGDESPPAALNMQFQDALLTVEITAHVKTASGGLDTALNQIAAEVYAAIFDDRTLGLAYVIDTRWQGRDRPERDQLEKPAAEQTLRIVVHYRHSATSTEN